MKTVQHSLCLAAMALLCACSGTGDLSSLPDSEPISCIPGTAGCDSGTASNAASITFTSPNLEAIEDRANGDYRLSGKVDVVDRDGRAVADGTSIDLILLDTVILQDNTGSVEAANLDVVLRSGNSLITTRCSSLSGGEATGCNYAATSSYSSTVVRSSSTRGIQAGDFVILRNADSTDRFRRVLSVTSDASLRLDRPLSKAYSSLQLWVGTAASGISAAGFDANNTLTPGRARTVEGEAVFRVTYPANVQSLRYGCFGYFNDGAAADTDLRDTVPQSRQVLLAATAPNGVTAVDVGSFCARAIAGGSVTSDIASVTLSPPADGTFNEEFVGLTFKDGGQQVRLAYTLFRCVRTEGPAVLTIGVGAAATASSFFAISDVDGFADIRVRRDPPNATEAATGTVECFNSADSTATRATITVNLPAPPAPPAP